jgi:uncharacterized protein
MTDAGALEALVSKQMVAAMKAHDAERTGTLRLIKTALKNKSIEKRAPLTPAEEQQALATMIKQRRDSIEQFTKGNRPELAEKEKKEAAIIEGYLPAGASAEEMSAAISKAIAETGANSIKQMGAVVKAAKTALEGKTVDGKALSDLVREQLAKLG